jgi:vesicle-fusing ATPase
MSGNKPAPIVDTNNTFEDLSGIATSAFSNPYDALIAACDDDAVRCLRKSIAFQH